MVTLNLSFLNNILLIMNENYKIAAILTCHNRKTKTVSCLKALFESLEEYKNAEISLKVYLTDDGCTDGTAELVKQSFTDKAISIIQGDGNLYWAGGMRLAWTKAKEEDSWDFYLLLNDDTIPHKNMFYELFNVHKYSLNKFNKIGIYSGVTSDPNISNKITYGGSVWVNKISANIRMLYPTGVPQEVDLTNANILLVPNEIVSKVGFFYDGYTHGIADYDYSIQVHKKGYKSLITANICGSCENDHSHRNENRKKILKLNLAERKKYFSHPLHSNSDYLLYYKRNFPFRYPLVWFGRFMNIYFPKLYYLLDDIRS